MEHTFCLTVDVTLKSALTNTFTLSICTSLGDFQVLRSAKDFNQFHRSIVKNKRYRGINSPTLPTNPRHGNAGQHYKNYLQETLHRIVWLKQSISFLNPPKPIKQKMMELYDELGQASKIGALKKRGHKFKSFRNRYFALYPNYIMEYYEKQTAYLTPSCEPKGCIDLTLVKRILTHDNPKHPYSVKLITTNRVWILQCYSMNDRKEWMNSINGLIQSTKYNGYIPECCAYHKNRRHTDLLLHGVLRENYDSEEFEEAPFQRIVSLCIAFYYIDI